MTNKQFKALLKVLKKWGHLNLEHIMIEYYLDTLDVYIYDNGFFDSGYSYLLKDGEYILVNEY